MSDVVGVIIFVLAGLFLAVLVVVGLSLGLNMAGPAIDHTTCIITQENTVIYEGPGYRLNCNSAGNITQCGIGKSAPFQFMVEKRIADTNLKVVCE